jgi:hypothetical protein
MPARLLSPDHLFYAYVGFMLVALALWGWMYQFKAYRFTRHTWYRAIPFLLVIVLFALGFNADHL